MSQRVCRLGDTSSHGGAVASASPDTYCNGIRVARLGDSFACPLHGLQTIASASTTVFVNNRGVARIGDSISCGAVLSSGSPDTWAG